MSSAAWDYAPWGPVHDYPSVEAFESITELPDGVHRIHLLAGPPLDLLSHGSPADQDDALAVPLFLSGALGDRSDSRGPYFSGRAISRRMARPFLALSDPLLAADRTVGLAWYTGVPNAGTQAATARVARTVARLAGSPLLAIGGSGGGFAALELASRRPEVRAFVWNPQVRILDYAPEAVRAYLGAMFGGDWTDAEWRERAADLLDRAGVVHDLTTVEAGHQYFYLQNQSDWHVRKHLAGFLRAHELRHRGRGYYSGTRRQGVLVGNFGDGHASPSPELIEAIITCLSRPDGDSWATNAMLNTDDWLSATDFASLPRDLSAEAESVMASLRLVAIRRGAKYECRVERPNDLKRVPVEFQFYAYGPHGRLDSSGPTATPEWSWTDPTSSAGLRIIATVRDGFGATLGQLQAIPTASASDPRFLVYGSCVTRDAFALSSAPKLHSYYARSSVASAMSGTPTELAKANLAANPSAFQRRMVHADLARTLPDEIRDGGFDYLVVDFIDERFDLAKTRTGALFTISPELVATGLDIDGKDRVRSGSDEHLHAFSEGWKQLRELIPDSRIIVNRVYWAEGAYDGTPFAHLDAIQAANRTLDRLYDIVQKLSPGIRWVTYPQGVFRSDPNHKWGLSPFHFGEELYERTVESLHSIAANSAQRNYLVIVETMFCDFELDPKVIDDYLHRWLMSLQQLTNIEVPEHADVAFVLYLSRDKVEPTLKVQQFLASLSPSLQQRFHLITYDHPDGGYEQHHGGHADLIKNPNKHAPRRDALFETALRHIDVGGVSHLIRTALDDDDFWLRWQLNEIIRTADSTDVSEDPVAVGLSRCCVAYFQEGYADVVDTSRTLTGNKYYLAPVGLLDRLRKLSPWGIPEVFDDNQRQRFARVGIELHQEHDHVPGWVYGRWGSNLTVDHKDPYYLSPPVRATFDTPRDALTALAEAITTSAYRSW